jgi:large subunit ribosomal protein L10
VPLNKEGKQAVVAEVSAQVAKAQTIVLAEYRGITVGDLTKLRAKAREQQVYLRVLKNTLARRAVEGTPFAPLAEQMTGPLIYGISEDAIAAAKVVNDFSKSNDKLIIKGGSYEGNVMDKAGQHPEPRRTALEAAVRHASACFRLCARSGRARRKEARRSCLIDIRQA